MSNVVKLNQERSCGHHQMQHAIVASLCDALNWISQQSKAASGGLPADAEQQLNSCSSLAARPGVAAACKLLLQDFQALLTCKGCAASAPAAVDAQSYCKVPELCERLSPGGDIFYLLKKLLSKPPYQGAETMSLHDGLSSLKQVHGELALNLQLHKYSTQLPGNASGTLSTYQQPLHKIKATLLDHLHLIVTLTLLNREELAEQLCTTDYDTGQVAGEAGLQRLKCVIGTVGLSAEQQEQIADSMELFEGISASLEQQCRQLQQELGLLAGQAAGVPAGTAAHTTGPDEVGRLLQHVSDTANNRRMLDRLHLLMMQQALVKCCFSCLVYGSLTYEQLSQVLVCMSPTGLPAPALAAAIKSEAVQQPGWHQVLQTEQSSSCSRWSE